MCPHTTLRRTPSELICTECHETLYYQSAYLKRGIYLRADAA